MSKTVSKSPDRHTFQREGYVKRQEEQNEPINEEYLNMFDTILDREKHKWDDPNSQKNNLEWDLVTTDWILEKVRNSDSYAQNLYAALCNMQWHNSEMWKTLKEEYWHCSWRYAGGIVADMRQKGDYIDWYCSGIRNVDYDEEVNKEWDKRSYVAESVVTDEIREDLAKLGWFPIPYKDE
jgi:hypothetical protein